MLPLNLFPKWSVMGQWRALEPRSCLVCLSPSPCRPGMGPCFLAALAPPGFPCLLPAPHCRHPWPLLGVWVWAQAELRLSACALQHLGRAAAWWQLSLPRAGCATVHSAGSSRDEAPIYSQSRCRICPGIEVESFGGSPIHHGFHHAASVVAGQRRTPRAGGLCSQGAAHPHPSTCDGLHSSCKYCWAWGSITLDSKWETP